LIDNLVAIIKMNLDTLIAECNAYAYDFKLMLDEKIPKSWLKSLSTFANVLGDFFFFRINNDIMVNGLNDVQRVSETISSKIRDYMDPLPDVEMIPKRIGDINILQLKINASSNLKHKDTDKFGI